MSLPPLLPQSNLMQTITPLGVAASPASTVKEGTQPEKNAKAPIESLQTLIRQLKITAPTTLTAKVEASGTVPQDLLSKLPANPKLTSLLTRPQGADPQATTPSTLWSTLRVARTLNILITHPNLAQHKGAQPNNPLTNPGSTLSVIVSPDGTMKIMPNQAQPASTAYNINSASANASASRSPTRVAPNSALNINITSSNASNNAYNNAAGATLSNTTTMHTSNTQTPMRNILSALSQLTHTLQSQQTLVATEPVSHLLNKLHTLNDSLKSLSPAIGQQLVPSKLLSTLMQPAHTNPLHIALSQLQAPNTSSNAQSAHINATNVNSAVIRPATVRPTTASALAPPTALLTDQLATQISQHSTAHKGESIQWLQQSLTLSQQLLIPEQRTPNTLSNTDLFSALLGSLPSAKRSAIQDIKESRHTIARWLTQELTQHIARTANGHIHNHAQNLERPNEWQQHIEIPLRWGDEFGSAQVRIEQKEAQHNKNTQNKAAASTDTQWEIAIDFELPQTPKNHEGIPQHTLKPQTLSVHLKLQPLKRQQSDLSVTFWSQTPALNQTIETRLSQLKQQLVDVGLNITQLSCHAGAPPIKPSTLQQSIIDIKT